MSKPSTCFDDTLLEAIEAPHPMLALIMSFSTMSAMITPTLAWPEFKLHFRPIAALQSD
jgi:hypothetical protein